MKSFLIILLAILGSSSCFAQNVGVNTQTPQASFNVAAGNVSNTSATPTTHTITNGTFNLKITN